MIPHKGAIIREWSIKIHYSLILFTNVMTKITVCVVAQAKLCIHVMIGAPHFLGLWPPNTHIWTGRARCGLANNAHVWDIQNHGAILNIVLANKVWATHSWGHIGRRGKLGCSSDAKSPCIHQKGGLGPGWLVIERDVEDITQGGS